MNNQTLSPEPHPAASSAVESSRPPVLARVQKILVADDEESIRQTLTAAITRAGFDVNVVSDGETAWAELQRERYDLLVTDNEMPRLSGLKLIERIRDAGLTMPVILASGSLSANAAQDYATLKIAAVLSKPFSIWEFLTMLRIALKEARKEATAQHRLYANSPAPRFTRPAKTVPPSHRHVLIADDDAVVRGSLAAVLQSEGYEVDEASNGIEAVNRALKHKPDLVLLDLNMPQADGWTAFNQLDRVTPLLPVIVITARPNQYPEAVRVGVDAFMEKPLNIPMLVSAVKRLTNEEEGRHVRRITNRSFVTQLLGQADASCPAS